MTVPAQGLVPGHVAFDFDGTLVRSNAIKRECFRDVLAEVQGAVVILDALFDEGFRGDRHMLFREVARRLDRDRPGAAPDADALTERYSALCRARIAAAPEVPGAGVVLERLSAAGARLYLISATPQAPLEEMVADRGLIGHFDRILGAPVGKDVHLAGLIAEHGIARGDIVLIGDGRDDEAAAAAVGCRFIAVTDAPTAPLDHVAERIPDLLSLPALLGLDAAGMSRM